MLVIDGPLHGFARTQVDALGQRAVAMVEQGLASGPVAIWDGELKRTSIDHDTVHDEP